MPGFGELVLTVKYVALAPAMRRWIALIAFGEPVAIAAVMEAPTTDSVANDPRPNRGGRLRLSTAPARWPEALQIALPNLQHDQES